MTSSEYTPSALTLAGRQLAQSVRPIYDFAEQTQPHTLVVCDRDARPIGFALEAYRQELGGLQSVEDRFYYRRISKRVAVSAVQASLDAPLQAIKSAPEGARIMVVDDYVSNHAGTLHMFRGICRKLGVEAPIDWVTLAGKDTAFNVFPDRGAVVSEAWRDRPEVIGIDYDNMNCIVKPTELSEMFYTAIRQGVHAICQAENSLTLTS
jgi:hypothetical protein